MVDTTIHRYPKESTKLRRGVHRISAKESFVAIVKDPNSLTIPATVPVLDVYRDPVYTLHKK